MRLLITGAKGQLGSELQAVLASGKTDIGLLPVAYQGAKVLAANADTLDITNEDQVEHYFAHNNPDIVINCAAFTNVDACESQSELAYRVNAHGAANLAAACQRSGATLVQLSTDYVFAGDATLPYRESDPTGPRSVYGASKLSGEQAIQNSCKRYFIVRTSWLYGQTGNNFVQTILRLARENGSIKVVNDQFGSPTNANDLAHQLLCLALTSEYGIYHCTGSGSCSWFEFASAIVEQAHVECKKIPCSTAEFPRRAARPKYSILDNTRLRTALGREMRAWPDALASFFASNND